MFGWNVSAWYSIFAAVAAKSTAVLALAWLVAALLRKRSAAARHLVWTGALAAVLALPFLSVSLPALRVRAAALWTPQPDAAFMATAASSAGAGATASTRHDATAAPFIGPHPPVDWRLWLMLVWLAGFSLAFARTLLAYAAALRLRRLAKPFPDLSLCRTLSRAIGMRRAVEILASGTSTMPMTFGLVRPTILMPAETVEWDKERRRIVLLHELAHVRRGDSATHLLARAALNLYWWNPLAWMAWREFLKERERAADDLVLSAGESASEYASHLLAVARTLQSAPAMEWATVAMARRSQLEGRLLAILDSRVNRAAAGRASVLAVALAAVAIVAPLAAVRAQERPAQAVADDVHAADAAINAARLQKNYERLDNAATAAAQLHLYDIAYKLQEASLSIRGDVFGGSSVESGVGFLKLAALEGRQHHAESAESLYAKAAQMLGDHPEAGLALTHLGIAAMTRKDFAQATDSFERARRADPAHAGTELMWMAVVEQRQEHFDDADRLYQSALALQDPKSVEAAVTLEVYGQFLQKQGHRDQAVGIDARATAIQQANGAPPISRPGPAVYRTSSAGVQSPSVVHKLEPEYSEEGRAAGLQGTVIVQVVIGTDGLAHDARIVKGLGLGLDEQALETIAQWRFKPGLKDGQPVPVTATIEVNWHLL